MSSQTDAYYEELSRRLKDAGPVSEYAEQVSYRELRERKKKPHKTSDIRWTIELKRRKNRYYFSECPNP